MALTVTHTFVSAKLDGADTTLLQPSDWNASHTIAGNPWSASGTTITPATAGDRLALIGAGLTSVDQVEIAGFKATNLTIDGGIAFFGFNLAHETTGSPSAYWAIERNYANNTYQAGGATHTYGEAYVEAYDSADATFRPMAFTWDNAAVNDFAVAAINISSSATYGHFKIYTIAGAELFKVGGDGQVTLTGGTNLQFPNANSYIQSAANTPFGVVIYGKYVWFDNAKDGLLFGSAQDTNLYRSAANTLKTDDALIIAAATYADEAAAAALATGTIYKTATGELRIKL